MFCWDPRARRSWGNTRLKRKFSPIRTVSFNPNACETLFMDIVSFNLYAPFLSKSWNNKCTNLLRILFTTLGVCWGKQCAQLLLKTLCVLFIVQEAWRIRSSKWCVVQSKWLFPFSSPFCFFSQLPVAECFQSPSMLCPNPLQCLSPTHQPQSYQNKAHQLMKANPIHRTKRKDPLCSTNAQAHLLSAWVIVAATVGLCIHG